MRRAACLVAFAALFVCAFGDVTSPVTEDAPSLVLAIDKSVEVQAAGNALAPGTKITGAGFAENSLVNFFANTARVPPGYGNVNGVVDIPLSDQKVEFGYQEPTAAAPLILLSADINTAGYITFSYYFTQAVTIRALKVTLKSPAFKAFRYLEAISSNLEQPVNGSLVDDTVTINTARESGFIGHIVQAVFKLRQCWYEGKCCDKETGLFKPSTTLCRHKASNCDVAEYCTGHDAGCPTDRDAEDGTKCLWSGPDDSDYGRYNVDTSSLKRTLVDASHFASIAAKHKDEVCVGRCKEGVCHMSKRAAACCTPASEDDEASEEEGEEGAIKAMTSGSKKVAAKTQHYCWE